MLFAGDLLAVLDVSTDDKVLPTTYGHLRPPLAYTDLRYGFTSFLVAEVGIARFSRVHQLHWLFQTSFTDCSEVVVGNGTDCGVYCCLVESKQ